MKKKKQENRGGARPGAGRPSINPDRPTRKIGARLFQDQVEKINRRPGTDFSDKLRNFIDDNLDG